MQITAEQKDALTELINIGVGHAASTLNFLINHKIRLTVPEIEILSLQTMQSTSPEDHDMSSVSMSFHGDFNGNASPEKSKLSGTFISKKPCVLSFFTEVSSAKFINFSLDNIKCKNNAFLLLYDA